MTSKYITAIDLGSDTIRGIVAAVDQSGSLSVLAVEQIETAEAVRHGRVQNARLASERVAEILRRLENSQAVAPARITSVFVANGGRSLGSVPANAMVKQGAEAEITTDTLRQLHTEARYTLATDREVLAIAPRRYFVDQAEVKKIVGAFGNTVRGEFTILTCSPENRRALDRVGITLHDQDIDREYVTRVLALTESALSESDRQRGAAFLDFGAETSTLAVFRDGALQMVATLPMGSANITRDLSSGLSITTDQAENIKRTQGRAVAARVGLETPDAQTREIIGLVSARLGEIIANINNILNESGFRAADLPAGLVVTGRGARLAGFIEMLEAQTRLKVREAAVDASITSKCDTPPAECFDLVALARYAAAHSDRDCLTLPLDETPMPEAEEEDYPRRQVIEHQPDRHQSQAPRYTRPVADDDPSLLADDPDELPEPSDDAAKTRRSLLDRIKQLRDWMAPPQEETGLDD